jgi:hypothetical protein
MLAAASVAMPATEGVHWVKTPAEASLAAQRNALLARVRTPYFVALSDQHELCRQTELEQLVAAIAEDRFDLAAGVTVRCRRKWLLFTERKAVAEFGTFAIDGDEVRAQPVAAHAEGAWRAVDLAGGFFAARTDRIRSMGGWEARAEAGQRDEFYWRAKRYGVRVGLCDAVRVHDWSVPFAETGCVASTTTAARMGVVRYVDLEGKAFDAPRQASAA